MSAAGLIVGHRRDSAIAHVRSAAQQMGCAVAFVDVEEFAAGGTVTDATSSDAVITASGRSYRLGDFGCIYQRVYPGSDAPPAAVSRLMALETALYASRSQVINRPFAGWQNMSKPLQMLMLQQAGFAVPVSRSTSIPDDYRRFRQQTDDTIYKSNSGERSIVARLSAEHDERAGRLTNCPALFQQRIVGDDVRVHVFRDDAFAVRIQSDAVDYRYYKARGSFARLEPEPSLPLDVRTRCIEFAMATGVVLGGFDFKIDAAGCWYCLEMNPAPAFESYDHVLGGVIGRRLVEALACPVSPACR
jgi:hypothetical protein